MFPRRQAFGGMPIAMSCEVAKPRAAELNDWMRKAKGSVMNRAIVISMVGLVGLAMTAENPDRAVALSMEQAMARCKEQVTPVVRACVRQKMMANRDTSPEPYIAGCRAPVVAQVKACVAQLIGAAGFKHQPVDEATAAKGPAKGAIARMRVAPPRTIADITAILDQEKPDPAKLKKLQTAADASEPAKSDSVALAHFYFGRSVARSELGRFREAVADGEQAVRVATGKVDQLVLNNFQSTVALQHLLAGEPKPALAVYLKMADTNEHSNNKGFLFIAYRQISNIYLMLGDLDRAQAYVQKIESIWRNAGSIPGYGDHGGNWHAGVEDAKGRLFEARGRTRRCAEFLPTSGTATPRQYREIRARDDRHSTYAIRTSRRP